MAMSKHRHRPLCEVCRTAAAELNFRGNGWKRRCSECQRAVELRTGRQSAARRKLEKSDLMGAGHE